jgi:hypothetical protein
LNQVIRQVVVQIPKTFSHVALFQANLAQIRKQFLLAGVSRAIPAIPVVIHIWSILGIDLSSNSKKMSPCSRVLD